MKEQKQTLFLQKARTVLLPVLALVLAAAIGIGFGRQGWREQNFETQALAADETAASAGGKKTAAQFCSMNAAHIFTDVASGNLLQLAAYKIGQKGAAGVTAAAQETQAAEETFDVISTYALAQDAMETVEQETLELMSAPAGTTWGGLIKVYAGDTPLLITEEDKEVLLRIVEAEATCEDIKGRILVANVILNRVLSKKFPDSITEVVFQNDGETYQFSPIKNERYWKVTISDKTIEAVDRVLAGEDYSEGALFFAARSMADKKAMSWFDRSLKFLFKYGVHEFFTSK